ncbi:MAG: hypothetical protein IJ452_00270 [Butyricicoccus sp.]|nr:hypothetical protein [Butyricicoccus sp.]MBQ8584700.1 hypothetical protein [Butyricicoccus sp.]
MKDKCIRFLKMFFSRTALFCLGICLGILLCRGYFIHTRTQSICREVKQLGMLVNNYHTAIERGHEPVASTYQQLRITSGAMTARLHDNYGAPPYEDAALRYLYGMACYFNKIDLNEFTDEDWETFFEDTMLLREVYLNGNCSADELFPTLNRSLDDVPIPQAFIDSHDYVTLD